MNIHALLVNRFKQALEEMGVEDAPVPISRSARPEFGEYQFNGAMALAKKLGQKPRDIADTIVAQVNLNDVADKLEVAGPGFINIHLSYYNRYNGIGHKTTVRSYAYAVD